MKEFIKLAPFFATISSFFMTFKLFFQSVFENTKRLAKHLNESQSKIYSHILAGIIFTFMLLYTLQRANYPFFHDSLIYWNLADSFSFSDLSFLGYSIKLRGYLFPFLLFLLKTQADLVNIDAKLLFYIYSALFFTVTSIYIIPWAFKTIFQWRTQFLGRALIALLIFYFWRGYFLYPLSDFPAIISLLIGVAFLAQTLRSNQFSFQLFLTGVFIGAAVNIRPIYQVSIIIILPILIMHMFKIGISKGYKWLLAVFLGISMILYPQLKVNQTHFNVNSPWVLATYEGGKNLYEVQLFSGLKVQRYETNVGSNYPSEEVIYTDPFIRELRKTDILKEKTLARYLQIIRQYPLEISVSFSRHLFNGLDIFYATPYVYNVYINHTLFSVINYSLWFFIAIYFIRMDLMEFDHIRVIGSIGILSPVVLAIPTAIEVRFFLPLYLLAYGVLAFNFDYINLFNFLFRSSWNFFRMLIIWVSWILLCFTLSSATIENLA